MQLWLSTKTVYSLLDPSGDSQFFPLARGIRQGCPLSLDQFIIFLSALTSKFRSFFQEIFSYTPWTFSSSHPLTDVEYADDTALMARTHETLSRLQHLLQHLAARIGFLLNGSRCQLLVIHGSLPVFLSLHADSYRTCKCPQCAPSFQVSPCEDSLDTPLEPLQSAKYLGSFITHISSSVPDVNFRCSQASSAFKSLDPYFRHTLFEFTHKYCRPFSSLSRVYSPAQIIKIDNRHYKTLRQIFKIKSPYYHRVLLPTDSPCSNECLLSLSYPILPTCVPSSLRISDSRLKYLGQILRHPSSPDSITMFNIV